MVQIRLKLNKSYMYMLLMQPLSLRENIDALKWTAFLKNWDYLAWLF